MLDTVRIQKINSFKNIFLYIISNNKGDVKDFGDFQKCLTRL